MGHMSVIQGLSMCESDVVYLTLMPNQSLRAKGSTVFFLRPFLPFDNLLFLHDLRLATPYLSVMRASNLGAECHGSNSNNVLSDSHLDEHLSLVWTNGCSLVGDDFKGWHFKGSRLYFKISVWKFLCGPELCHGQVPVPPCPTYVYPKDRKSVV